MAPAEAALDVEDAALCPQPFWGGPRDPQRCRDSLFAALHELDQVGEEHVPVALAEAVHVVGDLGGREGSSAPCRCGRGPWGAGCGVPYLARVVVDDKAGAPAVEVLVGAHGRLQLLQQGLVRPLAGGMHGGTDIVQDAHDPRGVLVVVVRGGGDGEAIGAQRPNPASGCARVPPCWSKPLHAEPQLRLRMRS